MILIIEIAFVLLFLGLLAKALFETAWGIILIITGLFFMAFGYFLQFIISLIKVIEALTLFLSPAKRRRMENLKATRALGRICLGRRI